MFFVDLDIVQDQDHQLLEDIAHVPLTGVDLQVIIDHLRENIKRKVDIRSRI